MPAEWQLWIIRNPHWFYLFTSTGFVLLTVGVLGLIFGRSDRQRDKETSQ